MLKEMKTMAQGNINIALGCNYLKDNGHIDETFGIFGVLEEAFTPVLRGIILPAKNNTECRMTRGTKICDVNCYKAVTVYQVGSKWSPQNKGKMM